MDKMSKEEQLKLAEAIKGQKGKLTQVENV